MSMSSVPQLDLSVVIAVGNLKEDLANLVDIISQNDTYGIETVLALDNQPREQLRALEIGVASCNKNVVIIEGDWRNPGTPRNEGLSKCTKSYVTFWDSDDKPNLESVNRALTQLGKLSYDAIFGMFNVAKANEISFEPRIKATNLDKALEQRVLCNPGLWRFIFNRAFIKDLTFPAFSSAEDQYFLQRFFSYSPKIRIYDEVFYTYVQGGNLQLTKSKRVAEQTLNVARLSLNEVLREDLKFFRLNDGLLLKQLVTILKFGNFVEKKGAVSLLWLFVLKVGFSRVCQAGVNLLSARRIYYLGKKPKVRVLLMGGLGNQLFQMAYATYLTTVFGASVQLLDLSRNVRRSKHGSPEILLYKVIQSISPLKNNRIDKILDRSFGYLLRIHLGPKKNKKLSKSIAKNSLSVICSFRFRSIVRIFVADDVGYIDWKPGRFSYVAIGYFQSFQYATHSQVLPILKKLMPISVEKEVQRYRILSLSEQPLLVHIRLGDYRSEHQFGILDPAYYRMAIAQQMNSGLYKSIWIFSDEDVDSQDYVPQQFWTLVREIYSVGTNSVSLLEVMRMCHGFVIANSTLSWWAASISKKENPSVYYPEPWFLSLPRPRELISPKWTPISRN